MTIIRMAAEDLDVGDRFQLFLTDVGKFVATVEVLAKTGDGCIMVGYSGGGDHRRFIVLDPDEPVDTTD